jgi:hypothetical protein
MIHNKIQGLFNGILSDIRLEKRAEKLTNDMLTFGKVIVNRFGKSQADKIGAYRMLSNTKVDYKKLCQGIYKDMSKKDEHPHLLCIQDTSEINLSRHKDLFKKNDSDVGQLTKKGNIGFFCHPMLVVDPVQQIPLGFSSIELLNRPWEHKNKYERKYKSLPIEAKESFRWIKSVNQTKETLPDIPNLTIVGDRECDIYEEMVMVPDNQINLLIRLTHNRKIYESPDLLFDVLSQSSKKSEFLLKIKSNRKRQNRTAKITVKYVKVKIQKPIKFTKLQYPQYPEYIEAWAIEARESSETVPNDEAPILWRLLTTHDINSNKDAMTYIEWYKQRWYIEELFRVLKKQGLDIESSQLSTGAAMKNLTVIALHVALVTMLLKLSMHSEEELSADIVFNNQQTKFLCLVNEQVQGKTLKQKNPYTKHTLAWAAWIIARLSGWSGYKSHGKAGYISLKRGYDIFNAKFDGYLIALKLFEQDVYKE